MSKFHTHKCTKNSQIETLVDVLYRFHLCIENAKNGYTCIMMYVFDRIIRRRTSACIHRHYILMKKRTASSDSPIHEEAVLHSNTCFLTIEVNAVHRAAMPAKGSNRTISSSVRSREEKCSHFFRPIGATVDLGKC